jgi:hypothetical protein
MSDLGRNGADEDGAVTLALLRYFKGVFRNDFEVLGADDIRYSTRSVDIGTYACKALFRTEKKEVTAYIIV